MVGAETPNAGGCVTAVGINGGTDGTPDGGAIRLIEPAGGLITLTGISGAGALVVDAKPIGCNGSATADGATAAGFDNGDRSNGANGDRPASGNGDGVGPDGGVASGRATGSMRVPETLMSNVCTSANAMSFSIDSTLRS
jgi:hypothetical protein